MIKSLFRNKGYNDLSTSYEHIVNNNYDYNYEREHFKVKVSNLDMLDKIIELKVLNKLHDINGKLVICECGGEYIFGERLLLTESLNFYIDVKNVVKEKYKNKIKQFIKCNNYVDIYRNANLYNRDCFVTTI